MYKNIGISISVITAYILLFHYLSNFIESRVAAAAEQADYKTADVINSSTELDGPLSDPFEEDERESASESVADPLEAYNRFMFAFNDKCYFYALQPAAKGYSFIVPESVRKCNKRLFSNILTPTRLVNNLLQGKIKAAGVELTRFAINTTWGIFGLFDPAENSCNLPCFKEDTGQTFG